MSNRISRSAAEPVRDEPMVFRSLPNGEVELVTDFAAEELVDPKFLGQSTSGFDTMIHMSVRKKMSTGRMMAYRASYRVVGWDDNTGAFKVRLVGTPVRR